MIAEGKKYRFVKGEPTVCQVLRIAPGAIPVFEGFADLVIGIVEGRCQGMIIPFGTLARFEECVVPA